MVQRLCCPRLIQGQPHCNLCHPMNHQNRLQWRDKCFLPNCCSMCMLSLVCALSKSKTWTSPSGDGGLDYFSLPSHIRTQKGMRELTKLGSLLTMRARSPPPHEVFFHMLLLGGARVFSPRAFTWHWVLTDDILGQELCYSLVRVTV